MGYEKIYLIYGQIYGRFYILYKGIEIYIYYDCT